MLLGASSKPMVVWEYAERYLNVGTRDFSPFSGDISVSEPYHPYRGASNFLIPSFWIGQEYGDYHLSDVSSSLNQIYCNGDRFILPVHPDTLRISSLHQREVLLKMPRGPSIEVAPLANVRTVLVTRIDGTVVQPHFLKLHYPRRISRFMRPMSGLDVGRQIWCGNEFHRVRCPALPDVGGGVFGKNAELGWGYIVRETEMASVSSLGGRLRFTVPLFALYGRDFRAPDDPTLLEQLVIRSGAKPLEFIAQRILEPAVRLWLKIVLETGCLPEMHGQNTLFIFPTNCDRSIIGYRDGGVYVDALLREALGLTGGLPPMGVTPRDVNTPGFQLMSLTYDSFMGHHALSRLNAVASAIFGFSDSALPSLAREFFSEVNGSRLILPSTVYYYDDHLHSNNGWHLIDTGQAPIWR